MPFDLSDNTHCLDIVQPPDLPTSRSVTRPGASPPANLATNMVQGGETLIRMKELVKILQISRATINRYRKAGTFPLPIKFSARCTAWRASVINDWLSSRPLARS